MPSKQYKNRRQLEEVKKELKHKDIVEIEGDGFLQRLFHKMLRRDGERIRITKDRDRGTLIFNRKN